MEVSSGVIFSEIEIETKDFVVLSSDNIDINAAIETTRDSAAGAVSTFIGTTRNTFEGMIISNG